MLVGNQRSEAKSEPLSQPNTPMNSNRIGVCHVTSGDRWAGAEVQLAMLLKALQRNKDIRISAIFLNEGRLADETRQSGIDVCVLPEDKYNFFQIFSRASQFLRHRNVQVLHSHRYKENLLAALLALRCGVPTHVTSKHGAPEPFTGWPRYKQGLIEMLDRSVARYSTDCVIGVSEELRRYLTTYLPPAKVVTIHNGIDEEKVSSPFTPAEAKQRLGISADCWVLGTAGRLDPIKRLDIFLGAAREITRACPNTKFLLSGEGKEEKRLRSLAATLGLQDHVLFLGHRDDVYDVLRAMDIFVLCSDHEGLPMALLEALYLAIPVVARPVGGISEVIQNGVSGVLLDSTDPSIVAKEWMLLLTNVQRRIEMAQAGRRLVADNFSVNKSADEVSRLYQSLSKPR